MSSPKCLTYVLCLGAVVLTLAPAQGTNPIHPNQPRRVELQRALASFASWTKRYATKSGTIPASPSIQEGIALAKQRRAALRELIRSDPALALEASIPSDQRKLLPEALTSELETPIYGTGDLLVACAMPAKGTQDLPVIQRLVLLDGHTYQAYVYGRRLSETTKFKIPLHGVALDGVLALHESVLSELDSSQATETTNSVIDVSKNTGAPAGAGSGPAKLARLGKAIYRFASLEHLQRCEALLEKAETESPAAATQPAAELLEQGPTAKSHQEPANHPRAVPSQMKKVLVIRTDFSDLPGNPHFPGLQPFTAQSAQAIADTQISPFYQNSSYGHAGTTFTVTPSIYRLPQTAANYAVVYSYYAVYNDALAAAQGDYVLTDYDIVVVLFSFLGAIPNSQIRFGGLTMLGTGMVWVNGEFDFRVVAHELGHTYGLYHANLWTTNDGNPISDAGDSVEYGDVFDTMGANWGGDPRADFNPWFKYLLNWIGDDQVQTVTTSGLYRVYRCDDAAATGTLALKIVKDQRRRYWIGCRRNFADNPTMSHGAYVVWGYDYAEQSQLLCLGQTPNNARAAALPLGGVLADPEANITVTAMDEGGTAPNQYVDVQVTFAPPPVIVSQPQSQELLEGQDAVFSVGTTGNPGPTYLWQCQTRGATNWVTLIDDAGCSGANSPTLLINSTTVSMSGSTFRCLLNNSAGGFNCSWPAGLTIDRFGTTTLAGQPGVAGQSDGIGWLAQFNGPTGIAVDRAGNSYVADSGNHVVRKITPAGAVSTLAGAAGNPGSTDGVGSDARLNHPAGIAVDTSGTVYVADQNNSTIRKITPDGAVTTLAGLAGGEGSADGAGTDARFALPSGIAVDCFGNLFVADTGNQTVRMLTPNGVVSTLAGQSGVAGSADGQGPSAQFNHPTGIAIDLSGNIYVSDQQNATIRKISTAAEVVTLAGTAGITGNADGSGSNARFSSPAGLAVDTAGTIYVADGTNSIRKITPGGEVSSIGLDAGTENSGNVAAGNSFVTSPTGVAVDSQGAVYIAEGSAIRLIRSGEAPAPLLCMSIVEKQIILSWPASASNFTLEMRSDLSAGGSWTAVTGEPTVVGCSLVFTNELQSPAAFYRLHKR